jgi:MinD-like ATPase involved in chromosome partitioning or flagellar assembly
LADHEPPPAERSGPARPPWLSQLPATEEPREQRRRGRRSKENDTTDAPREQAPAPVIPPGGEIMPPGVIKRVPMTNRAPAVEHPLQTERADEPQEPAQGVPRHSRHDADPPPEADIPVAGPPGHDAEGEPGVTAPAAEVDEIEARAARLLALMEARRAERPESAEADASPTDEAADIPSEFEAGDDAAPVTDVAGEAEPDEADPVGARADRLLARMHARREQPRPEEPTVDAADQGSPSTTDTPGAPDSAVPGALEPTDATRADPFVPDPQTDPFQATAQEPPRNRPDKRIALPPWQVPTTAMSAEFDPRLDATGRQAVREPPESRAEQPRVQPEPAEEEPAPPPPGWPPPPPGWQGPAPGWGPLPPPPPPPGFRVPPPWAVMPLPPPGWLPPAPGQPAGEEQSALNDEAGRHAAPPVDRRHQDARTDWVPPPSEVSPPSDYRAPQPYRMPPSLDEAEIFNRGRHAPQSGWRRTVHMATGGRINPGDSRKNRDMQELLAQIRQPIVGDFRIAVLSIKGGVGKTTTTLGLGSALAMVRTDRVIAVDANPDRGTLAERVRDYSTRSTVRDLLRDRHISRYADVRAHTRMASSRLEVLASEQDPAVAEVFGEADYRHTMDILRHYYNVILTDCGTGIMHSAMAGVLDLAHAIVLVSSPAIDAARSASATLDWLMQHGHAGLVREAHVVLSASRPGSAALKLDKVYEHFDARCRSIHLIPFDEHLAEGADIDFGLLKPATMQAYIELAGAVSEKFTRLRVSYDGR